MVRHLLSRQEAGSAQQVTAPRNVNLGRNGQDSPTLWAGPVGSLGGRRRGAYNTSVEWSERYEGS